MCDKSGSSCDEEDPMDCPVMTSSDENNLIKKFRAFLASQDGGRKAQSVISKHVSTLMQIVRYVEGNPVLYANLTSRAYLNAWQTYALDKGKEPSKQIFEKWLLSVM